MIADALVILVGIVIYIQIYINEELHYVNGYTVTVTPSDAVQWSSPSKNMIHVEHDASKLQPEAIITVVIKPQ